MKNALTVLLTILFFHISLSGQNNFERYNNDKSVYQFAGNNETPIQQNSLINKHKLDSTIYESYNSSSSQWINSQKTTHFYDIYGKNTVTYYYIWDDSPGQWIEQEKNEFTFNTSGQLTEKIQYKWDTISSQWTGFYKSDYSYNTNGKINLFEGYDWSNNQWYMEDKEEYMYDPNGYMIQFIDYDWNQNSNQWYAAEKEDFTINTSGKIVELLGYDWDTTNIQWVNDDKKIFTYNISNDLTELLDYRWLKPNNQWNFQDKQEYTYDVSGNITELVSKDYDAGSSQWITFDKFEGTFNNTYSYSNLVLPLIWFPNLEPAVKEPSFFYEKEQFFKHKLTDFTRYTWDNSNSQWKNDYRATLYYSEGNFQGIFVHDQAKVEIFPNPVVEVVNVRLENSEFLVVSFELLDISGKIFRQGMIEKSNEKFTIKVSDTPQGVYVLRILFDNNIFRKKLVIMN
ncbi:T9SS type A sorting domain-containing protein [Bacteroidota bacterium]